MRGKIGLGTLKLLIGWTGIWAIVDFIIALSNYSNYKNLFLLMGDGHNIYKYFR
jgi:TM2 domain-containing membrane protein YozV